MSEIVQGTSNQLIKPGLVHWSASAVLSNAYLSVGPRLRLHGILLIRTGQSGAWLMQSKFLRKRNMRWLLLQNTEMIHIFRLLLVQDGLSDDCSPSARPFPSKAYQRGRYEHDRLAAANF